MKKKVLLINWGTGSAVFPLGESKKLKEYEVFLVSTQEIPKSIHQLFDMRHLIFTNPYNVHVLLRDIEAFQKKYNLTFDIVTTFFEMNVLETAFVAEYLQVPHRLPLSAAMKTSVNKFLMRSTLTSVGIVQPRYSVFSTADWDKAYRFLKKVKKNCVIKPIHSGHSFGARLVLQNATIQQFTALIKDADNDFTQSYDEWMDYDHERNRGYLIEEYIEGNIYSFDGVIAGPKNITFIGTSEFEMTAPPILQQIGYTSPLYSLKNEEIKKGEKYTRQVIRALGLQYCGFHCELKFSDGQPYLIEISGRLPGGPVLESYQAISPKNIFSLFLNSFLGGKEERNSHPLMSASRGSVHTEKLLSLVKQAPATRKEKTREYTLSLQSVSEDTILVNKDSACGAWLYDVDIWSSVLTSNEVREVRNSYLEKHHVLLQTGWVPRVRLLARTGKRIIKQWLKQRVKRLYVVQS